MLKKILIGLAGVLLLLAVVIATRPSHFRVERSITIASSPDAPYALVNDFHKWSEWSPYDKLDPQMTRTFDGEPSGVGAGYGWAGNDKAGVGHMLITKAEPGQRIDIKLDFTEPMKTTNQTVFTFTKVPEGTKVTWAMDGEKNFVSKAFWMVMDADTLIGGDFAKGLAAIKAASESTPKASASATP